MEKIMFFLARLVTVGLMLAGGMVVAFLGCLVYKQDYHWIDFAIGVIGFAIVAASLEVNNWISEIQRRRIPFKS